MKYLIIIFLLFCSCSYIFDEPRRSCPNYDNTFNTMLLGTWISIDSSSVDTLFLDYGTGNVVGERYYEFVWKSNNKKITYSRYYPGSSGFWFGNSNPYWSEDRYISYTFTDNNLLNIHIEENEFDPEGDPIPESIKLRRVIAGN